MDLPIPFHYQDTEEACGAACAQMVIQEIFKEVIDQSNFYERAHGRSGAWSISPDALATTLTETASERSPRSFKISQFGSLEEVSRWICWRIFKGSPVIALVKGGAHWAVITGFQATKDPLGPTDNTYEMLGFFSNDPERPSNVQLAEHSSGDACIDDGGHDHISFDDWRIAFMRPVNVTGPYRDSFVVCDDFGAPAKAIQKSTPQSFTRNRLRISPEDAVKQADSGMLEFNLAKERVWASAIAAAKPTASIFVERLDDAPDYYIVTYSTAKGENPLTVIVEAESGKYLRSKVGNRETATLFRYLDQKGALAAVLEKRFKLGDVLEDVVVQEKDFKLHPNLVWKPCRESLSPYLPFFMLTSNTHKIYVRIDGRIATTLSPAYGN